ncbi:carbohydrate ABC transporter membrane protein 2 (CUT1 family) [Haloactinopolyspora alba]|uniref:Carbohydrate ABC transporter membrane protein 2 (CUT1 family) n=1 Tax=Haloactinopolyspora alba TaxID=648780 RepID=A0A2P8EG18_9ACTN|nr:carbohydrate ABC transporter permease [Haloactinopolyspora alba]PSL08415.1 carbohydrate ABC transporter membrane protein 2 (CUT1 family) [Haloactinopolyspora alba]
MTVPTTSAPVEPATATVTAPPLRRKRHGWRREIIVSLILLPICLIWIYPFLWMVGSSLKTDTEIFGSMSILPEDPQWENYSRAWYEANIGPYFWNTIFITVATIAIVTITTAMIGYVIGRYPFPGKKALVVVLIATLFLPEGYTIIPVFDLINQLGLSGSLWGIILAESGGAHVIQIMLFAGYFRQLPRELDEAARIDGAGFVRTFWTVMLPLAKPAIATAIILSLMRVWNSFLIPLVLTLPQPELRTLAVGVYSFQGENMTDWSGMAAASTIALLPIVIVFLLLQRYFVEGVAGAVRG